MRRNLNKDLKMNGCKAQNNITRTYEYLMKKEKEASCCEHDFSIKNERPFNGYSCSKCGKSNGKIIG